MKHKNIVKSLFYIQIVHTKKKHSFYHRADWKHEKHAYNGKQGQYEQARPDYSCIFAQAVRRRKKAAVSILCHDMLHNIV